MLLLESSKDKTVHDRDDKTTKNKQVLKTDVQ